MINIPEQVLLSDCSWYPVLQEQWYEPCVFVHTWEHLSVLSLHSSISKINVVKLLAHISKMVYPLNCEHSLQSTMSISVKSVSVKRLQGC